MTPSLAAQLTDRDLLFLYTRWLLQALDAGDTARVDALAAKRAAVMDRLHITGDGPDTTETEQEAA
jgi:hypothetical protein